MKFVSQEHLLNHNSVENAINIIEDLLIMSGGKDAPKLINVLRVNFEWYDKALLSLLSENPLKVDLLDLQTRIDALKDVVERPTDGLAARVGTVEMRLNVVEKISENMKVFIRRLADLSQEDQ